MHYEIDPAFRSHFRDLKQVFLYITDVCNLRCTQCLYKPNLTFHMQRSEMPLHVVRRLARDFRELGAVKLTLLGGEPTLYRGCGEHGALGQAIEAATQCGYEYVRMSTNGTFGRELIDGGSVDGLSEMAFSLDGPTAAINDRLRGAGVFELCVGNVRRAVSRGLNASITCCIHAGLLERGPDGVHHLERMIFLAQDLGARTVNFHDLVRGGTPMDTWTPDLAPDIADWVAAYRELSQSIVDGRYDVSVRLPICFVTQDEFARSSQYYGYCPAKLGERVMIHVDGTIRICSNLICSPYRVAWHTHERVVWNHSDTNELLCHDLTSPTPCTNRSRVDHGGYVPLCFSLKPSQDEHVWESLDWESRRTSCPKGGTTRG